MGLHASLRLLVVAAGTLVQVCATSFAAAEGLGSAVDAPRAKERTSWYAYFTREDRADVPEVVRAALDADVYGSPISGNVFQGFLYGIFEANPERRQEWLAAIGDVSPRDAMLMVQTLKNIDDDAFYAALGIYLARTQHTGSEIPITGPRLALLRADASTPQVFFNFIGAWYATGDRRYLDKAMIGIANSYPGGRWPNAIYTQMGSVLVLGLIDRIPAAADQMLELCEVPPADPPRPTNFPSTVASVLNVASGRQNRCQHTQN